MKLNTLCLVLVVVCHTSSMANAVRGEEVSQTGTIHLRSNRNLKPTKKKNTNENKKSTSKSKKSKNKKKKKKQCKNEEVFMGINDDGPMLIAEMCPNLAAGYRTTAVENFTKCVDNDANDDDDDDDDYDYDESGEVFLNVPTSVMEGAVTEFKLEGITIEEGVYLWDIGANGEYDVATDQPNFKYIAPTKINPVGIDDVVPIRLQVLNVDGTDDDSVVFESSINITDNFNDFSTNPFRQNCPRIVRGGARGTQIVPNANSKVNIELICEMNPTFDGELSLFLTFGNQVQPITFTADEWRCSCTGDGTLLPGISIGAAFDATAPVSVTLSICTETTPGDAVTRCCDTDFRSVELFDSCPIDQTYVPLLLNDGACDTGFGECSSYQPVTDSINWCNEMYGDDENALLDACITEVLTNGFASGFLTDTERQNILSCIA